VLRQYLKSLYERTMKEAYGAAFREMILPLNRGGECLDCGANRGYWYHKISQEIEFDKSRYYGIEWNQGHVEIARNKDLNVTQGDLNKGLPYGDEKFACVFALSVLEHLLNGCRFIKECYRVLNNKGTLILLTPNISTYFTVCLLLLGKMPSSGPHPDSDALMLSEELYKVSNDNLRWDAESDTPEYRHLVVFSFRVLRKYLKMVGFSQVTGYGFGLYPFPNFMQPLLEKIDPCHCHQMVFIARK